MYVQPPWLGAGSVTKGPFPDFYQCERPDLGTQPCSLMTSWFCAEFLCLTHEMSFLDLVGRAAGTSTNFRAKIN